MIPDERTAWLLIAGTIPVGLLGAFLEKPVRELCSSTLIVAIFLMINAGVMFLGGSIASSHRGRDPPFDEPYLARCGQGRLCAIACAPTRYLAFGLLHGCRLAAETYA